MSQRQGSLGSIHPGATESYKVEPTLQGCKQSPAIPNPNICTFPAKAFRVNPDLREWEAVYNLPHPPSGEGVETILCLKPGLPRCRVAGGCLRDQGNQKGQATAQGWR